MNMTLSRIRLIDIPFGLSVDEFSVMSPFRAQFCDAKVLDALIFGNPNNNEQTVVDRKITKKLIAQLGEGTGPIYFLGTTFTVNEKEEGVAILNRGTLPAIRYLIRTKQPITSLEWNDSPSSFAAVYLD
jgi:hypothetical protein